MHRILVLNAKGGSGKTTLATNLAACYATRGHHPALMDYDIQGSALNWLALRGDKQPAIHGLNAHKRDTTVTRSFQMRLPREIDRVIMDTPSGVTGSELAELVRQADTIIIPVLPSPIDIHTVTNFIREILMLGRVSTTSVASAYDRKTTRLGIVANRVKENTRVYKTLESFLSGLNLPFVTAFQDSQYYIHAFIEGRGIHELEDARIQTLYRQWQPLLDWIDDSQVTRSSSGASQADLLRERRKEYPEV